MLGSSSYLWWNNKMEAGVCICISVCRGCVFMQNMWLSSLIRTGKESLPESRNNVQECWAKVTFSLFVFGVCYFSIWNQPAWASVPISCTNGWAEGVSAGGVFCEEGASRWGPSEWGGAEADMVLQTEPGRPSEGVPEVNMNERGGNWRHVPPRYTDKPFCNVCLEWQ